MAGHSAKKAIIEEIGIFFMLRYSIPVVQLIGKRLCLLATCTTVTLSSFVCPLEVIADPSTGILPICPEGIIPGFRDFQTPDDHAPTPAQVLTNPNDHHTGHEILPAMGIPNACALQNWIGNWDVTSPNYAFPKAVNARAEPNIIEVKKTETQVQFIIEGAGIPSPHDVWMPECMPNNNNSLLGPCTSTSRPESVVFVRIADENKVFDGKWTALNASNNFYFKMTRLGSCSGTQGSPPQFLGNSAPCTYNLKFNFNSITGQAAVNRPMQVVVAFFPGGQVGSPAGLTYARVGVPLLFVPPGGGEPKLEAERPAPNGGFKTEVTDAVAGETIRFRGIDFDPDGGPIQMYFAGKAIGNPIAPAVNFQSEFKLQFLQYTRSDLEAGKAPCAGALQAVQGDKKVSVNIFGKLSEEIFNGANLANAKGEPLSRGALICGGEYIYPQDGVTSVPFVGFDPDEELPTDPTTGKYDPSFDPTYICEGKGLSQPHLLITLPVDDGGRTLPDGKSVGRYFAPWLQYRTVQGECIDIRDFGASAVFIDGKPVYKGPGPNVTEDITLSPRIVIRPIERLGASVIARYIFINSVKPDPRDVDNDGIENDVDRGDPPKKPNAALSSSSTDTQSNFSHQFNHPNGLIKGEILERNLHKVGVKIDPDYPDGLIIEGPSDGFGPSSEINICNAKLKIKSGDKIRVSSCAPLTIAALAGGPSQVVLGSDVEIEFGSGHGFTGDALGGSQYLVTAFSSNSGTIKVTSLPSTSSLLGPGQFIQLASRSDIDLDGVADIEEQCINDYSKRSPGLCGCNVMDSDSDQDGALDCQDPCPLLKNTAPGACGCGNVPVIGLKGASYCGSNGAAYDHYAKLQALVKQLRKETKKNKKAQNAIKAQIKARLAEISTTIASQGATITLKNNKQKLSKLDKAVKTPTKLALKNTLSTFDDSKAAALKAISALLKQIVNA